MKVDELMAYVIQQVPSNMGPGVALPTLPLMLTEDQLNEIIDGTDLTAAQWLQVAFAGIVTLPDDAY